MSTITCPEMRLEVDGLSVTWDSGGNARRLLHDITFAIRSNEIVGIIGESGSGKTMLSRALTNLFPPGRRMMVEGSVRLNGCDLLSLERAAMIDIRRRSIRYIFQEPASALNPALRIRKQFELLPITANGSPDGPGRLEDSTISNLLMQTGIKNPSEVLRSYAHQLSVGILQRVSIAMAILGKPRLLIADEPTSAVDASLRYQILDLLQARCRTEGMALLLTTHDLNVVRTYADRVFVLYAGRIVESATREDFFRTPRHPYSAMLLSAFSPEPRTLPVPTTASEIIPDKGCRFAARCPKVQSDCRSAEPALFAIDPQTSVRCPYWK